MTDLVTVSAFAVALIAGAFALLLVALWCGWYVRHRERAIRGHVDDRIAAGFDELSRSVNAQLATATRDFALATARINEAAQQIDRVESALQAQARINDGTARVIAEIQQTLHSGRHIAQPHPDTLDELERIHDRLTRIDERMAAVERGFESAVLGAALRFTHHGKA